MDRISAWRHVNGGGDQGRPCVAVDGGHRGNPCIPRNRIADATPSTFNVAVDERYLGILAFDVACRDPLGAAMAVVVGRLA